MIAIDNKLISDEIIEEQFVCDLSKCKGACCEDGEAGAPIEEHFGWVTPTIDEGLCVYGYKKKDGVIQCSFEQAYNEGKIGWKKPISCHLFPIRVDKSSLDPEIEYLNYEPRASLCDAACKLGKKNKVPVYVFLKEPIIRKYGEDFYEALAASAEHINAD